MDNFYKGIGLDLISNVNYKRYIKWRRLDMTLEVRVMVRRLLHLFQHEPIKSGIKFMTVGEKRGDRQRVKKNQQDTLSD